MSTHPIPVLLYEIIQDLRARNPDRVPLIGVAGAQGSGKSYQCRILTMANQPRFAHFSLDDVYLTKAEREQRADVAAADLSMLAPGEPFHRFPPPLPHLHAMFATRGPPGTHDRALANGLIARLAQALPTALPRFDKARDDREPEEAWPIFRGPAEAIVIDGWCLGATPPPASAALNALEEEDVATWRGVVVHPWRTSVESELKAGYAQFFECFDAIVYLRPPNWEIVRAWRGQQEEQMLGRPLTAEEGAKLDRFMMFYERITRSMMAGNHSANWVVQLDEARKVTRIEEI